MRCLSFFTNATLLGKKLCIGTCLKCLTVAMPLYVIVNIYILRVQRSLYISYFKGLLTRGKNKHINSE